jgi:hypothetical protein
MATSARDERAGEIEREVESRIESRTRARLDSDVERRIEGVKGKIQQRVLQPLLRTSLRVDPVELSSTDDVAVARYRVAGDDQLGANTLRPLVSAGSLASIQIHESAVRNLLSELNLAGKDFEINELIQHLAQRFDLEDEWLQDVADRNISLRFSETSPIQVRFDDGTIDFELRFDRFSEGSRTFRDLVVRVQYRPEAKGLSAELVREGHVAIAAGSLRLSDRAKLTAIFAKVFPQDRRRGLLPADWVDNPQLAGLQVRDFYAANQWLTVSLGPPQEVAASSSSRPVSRDMHLKR